MTLDAMLDNMLDAIEAQNYWDTEAYASMALQYIQDKKHLEPLIDKAGLVSQLKNIVVSAQKQTKNKNKLINEIVNFKG
jgi:hypothetical protein